MLSAWEVTIRNNNCKGIKTFLSNENITFEAIQVTAYRKEFASPPLLSYKEILKVYELTGQKEWIFPIDCDIIVTANLRCKLIQSP